MKKITAFLLLILLSGLMYLSGDGFPAAHSEAVQSAGIYSGGILISEIPKVDNRVRYRIDAGFDVTRKEISVKEKILWINKTLFPASEIQFHLYGNAYKSNKTLFANAYPLTPESQTHLNINKFLVNGRESDLIYFQPEIENPHDSTVAKVKLEKEINPGDTVSIYFEYTMKIPRSVKRMGYAAGRNFFFVSQWFPKIGVFEDGKWVCSQYHPYLNFYSDFGDYSVNIKVPKNYTVAATGVEDQRISGDNSTTFHFTQNGVHDFVWLASDEILS
ncbi:MAG: hypothetical protein WC061_06775, partial [Melioribacteraceae bacterium]